MAHTYLLDFTSEGTWSGADMRLRLDPVDVAGATFEVEYIRVRKDANGLANIFAGVVGSDRNTASNWIDGVVPSNASATVRGGVTAVVSSAVADISSLKVGGNGAVLQVSTGGSLAVITDASIGSGGEGLLNVNGGTLSLGGTLIALGGSGFITIGGSSATVTVTRNDGEAGVEIQNGASLNFVMGAEGVSPVTLNGNATASLSALSILTIDGSAYTGGAVTIPLVMHNGYADAGVFGTVTISGFIGLLGEVQYAADVINLVLEVGYPDAVALSNPSFEAQYQAIVYPGYGAITGWDFYPATPGTDRHGVNPASDGRTPFANNGVIPDQGAAAFLQDSGAIGQTLTNLDTNSTYWLQFWYNARAYLTPQPELKAEFAGVTLVDWMVHTPVDAVGGTNDWNYTNVVFTPAGLWRRTCPSQGVHRFDYGTGRRRLSGCLGGRLQRIFPRHERDLHG